MLQRLILVVCCASVFASAQIWSDWLRTGNTSIGLLLSDPARIADVNVSTSGLFAEIRGQFTQLQLYGVSGLQIERLALLIEDGNVANLSGEVSVPSLSLGGQYLLDGTAAFVPVSGDGPFWINATNVKIRGHSLLDDEPRFDTDVGDVALNFEDLMGGGTWGSISNSLLNTLGEMLVGELQNSLLTELARYLKLTELPRFDLDDLLRGAAVNIPDPLPLESASLTGLSTLRRDGAALATLHKDGVLQLESGFRFDNLSAHYAWRGWAIEAWAEWASGRIRVTQRPQYHPVLDELNVNDLGQLKIQLNMQGLGQWSHLLEAASNLAVNAAKMRLADMAAGPARDAVQKQLDSTDLFLRVGRLTKEHDSFQSNIDK